MIASAQQTEPEHLIERGHWKRARTLVEARLRLAPDDPLAHFLLSQIRYAFGDRTSPRALAEQSVSSDGSVAKYHRQLAEVLGIEAQHAGPIQQLLLARRFRREIDRALELDPRDVRALRDLIEFYLLAPGIAGGDLRKAQATAERIAEIDSPEGFLAQARIAESRKQPAAPGDLLRQAAQSQPPSYRALMALVQFYCGPGTDPGAAESTARKAIALDPSRRDAYAILAGVYADRQDWKRLDPLLELASRQSPDDLVPYYRAASHLLTGGRDPARAERYLRVYLGQEPEGNEPTAADAHWKLGLALDAQGSTAEAVAEWKESVRLDPASPAARELKHIRPTRTAPAATRNERLVRHVQC